MGEISLLAAILVAFPFSVFSVPLNPLENGNGGGFSIKQTARPKGVWRSPATSYAQALLKFQGPINGEATATLLGPAGSHQDGSVTAIPEPYDTEYLSPITIGGQEVNVAIDTGSADL